MRMSIRSWTLVAAVAVHAPEGRAQVLLFEIPTSTTVSGIDFVGDVDGDGVSDFAVGSPFVGNGRVILYSGANRSVLLQWDETIPDSYFGLTVSEAGDVDLDGVPDVLVGSPHADDEAGRVHLFSGATGAVLHRIAGDPNSFLGLGFAALGDVDGDGWPDYAVSATGWIDPVMGFVHLISGRTGERLSTLTNGLWSRHFGRSIASVGDIDGDGVDDLAVASEGFVYVYSGATSAQIYIDSLTYEGSYSVSGVGDVDGDQVPDWAYSLPLNDATPQAVRLISGGTGVLIRQWMHSSWSSYFGRTLEAAGDVNLDGVPDLWISHPHTNGPNKVSLVDGASLEIRHGIPEELDGGLRLAGGADLDGDGAPDLLLGWAHLRGWRIGCSTDPIDEYCVGAPNSVGAGARMGYAGSSSVHANDLVLRADDCPPGQVGLFLCATSADQLPLGDGWLCLAPPIYRLNPPAYTGSGTASRQLDLTAMPSAVPPVLAGSRWHFQYYYRDPGHGLAGFNLSDGMRVEFCP